MDVMDIRRRLLMMQSADAELYPVGTNIYDGIIFSQNNIDRTTGELVQNSTLAASDFLKVSTEYEYTRS